MREWLTLALPRSDRLTVAVQAEQAVGRAGSWPAAAGPGEVFGYLLARHVPLRYHPDGFDLVRAVAGVGGPPPPYQSSARSRVVDWLVTAQECAARLGPPPGLAELVEAPADGVIRSERTAARLLAAYGWDWSGGMAPLRLFARWCGVTCPWTVTQVGTTSDGHLVHAVVDRTSRIVKARQAARAAIAPVGVVRRTHLLNRLQDAGVELDRDLSLFETHAILGTAGDRTWVVLHCDTTSVLASLMRRLAGALGAVPLSAAHRGLARHRPRDVPADRPWPPTPAMLRAWVTHQRDWALNGPDERITPTGPLRPPRPSDVRLVDALRDGPLGWVALQDALIERGVTAGSSNQMIVESHLIRRDRPRGRYHLLHQPSAPSTGVPGAGKGTAG